MKLTLFTMLVIVYNIINSTPTKFYFYFFADPPKVQLSLGKNIDPLSIAEGNDVYLDCAIKANPRAYKVEWMHNVSTKPPPSDPLSLCRKTPR